MCNLHSLFCSVSPSWFFMHIHEYTHTLHHDRTSSIHHHHPPFRSSPARSPLLSFAFSACSIAIFKLHSIPNNEKKIHSNSHPFAHASNKNSCGIFCAAQSVCSNFQFITNLCSAFAYHILSLSLSICLCHSNTLHSSFRAVSFDLHSHM